MVDYQHNPAVHIFADTEAALARMRGTAETAGCRIVSALTIGADSDPSASAVPGATVLIELEEEEPGEGAVDLLDWALDEAGRGARRSLISVPAGLIDLVAARAWHADIEPLCGANEEERLAAVAEACRQPEARLHDNRRERHFPILQPVPEENAAPAGPDEAKANAAFIRTMIRARRLRAHYFRADLFADPAWDMPIKASANPSDSNEFRSFSRARRRPPTPVPFSTGAAFLGSKAIGSLARRRPEPPPSP